MDLLSGWVMDVDLSPNSWCFPYCPSFVLFLVIIIITENNIYWVPTTCQGSPLRASHEDPDEPSGQPGPMSVPPHDSGWGLQLTSAYRMQWRPHPAQSRLKFKEGLAVTTPTKIPLLRIPPRKLTHRLVQVLSTAALFIIDEGANTKCPSISEWINEMYIYTIEYSAAIKRIEALTQATMWMKTSC